MSPTAIEALRRPIADRVNNDRRVTPGELDIIHQDMDVNRFVLDIVKYGKKKDINVRASVTAADVELTIEGAHQLTMTIRDTHRNLYRSGALDTAIDMVVKEWGWRLVKDEKSGDDISLTFEPRPVAYLRQRRVRRKVVRGKVTRAEFVFSLVRGVKKHRIKFFCPELHKTQPIEKPSDRDEAGRRDRRESGLDGDFSFQIDGRDSSSDVLQNLERVLTVGARKSASDRVQVATVMCVLQESRGKTSATNGVHVGLFQQNPAYWPGTRNPETDANAWYDAVIPKDKANPRQPLYLLIESVQRSGQARNYAPWRDEAEKVVNAFQGGGGSPSKERRRKYQFRVKKGENWWGTVVRLAEEVQWRAFTIKNTLYFMSEEDLFKSKSIGKIREGQDGIDYINYSRDSRRKVKEVTVVCRMKMWPAPIGSVVTVDDGGSADGKYLVVAMRRSYFSSTGEIVLRKPMEERKEPLAEVIQDRGADAEGSFENALQLSKMGAKAIVDEAAALASRVGGAGVYVGSDYRPGSVTSSGTPSDHSSNDRDRAARDIGVRGIDLLVGPPSPRLDRAVAAIGEAFGRDYGDGHQTIIDTFIWKGWRVQIIWRTPLYGGHMGHIHIGVRKA